MFAPLLAFAMTAAVPTPGGTLYDFTMKDIDGAKVPLKKYKGKVCLVVNVASQCGYTPQYEGLQKLYATYKDRGLVVLGFPANEFRAQEPGTDAEIKQFCTSKYSVTFPMFSKIVVKGDGIAPLYKWLVESGPRQEEIEWNFSKFLVGRDGVVIDRYLPKVTPTDPALAEAIEKALG